jgi:hypothetical protein
VKLYVRLGSNSEVTVLKSDFRCTPETGHHRPGRSCRFRANRRHQRCYSITSSAPRSVGGMVRPQSLCSFCIYDQLIFGRGLPGRLPIVETRK